jgi:anti-sigma B factor antagonist
VVVKVSGEVDLQTAPRLSEELRRVQPLRIQLIVDLEEVEFMDCAGLRAVVRAATAAGPGRPRTSITPGPPQVQKLFRLTGIERTLRIVKRPGEGHAVAPERVTVLRYPAITAPAAADAA